MASTYAFGNEQEAQRERLRTLEALFDPWTIDRLAARECGCEAGVSMSRGGEAGGSRSALTIAGARGRRA